ncbi:aldo/keto reductase [Paraburkholderia sp. RL17-337-BIB-A]|uniref:aldo/keto reductase n=1 Tax=Paraburkholderia sp. RL17-337-BIB-A TaxID=3031636 RepID=UPI0038B6E755
MTFGEEWGWGASVADSEAILTEYAERGGNFIDTANIYTNGHSEKIIGDFLSVRPALRDRIVLATKFFGNLDIGNPNGGGAGRKAIVKQCEESLRRLQTDYIDLYWLHNWDRTAPIEETLRAMDDLVASGKVRYLGLSDLPAWKAAQAQTIAHFRGYAPAIALQAEYSLLARTVEGELVPMAQELGLGVMPWGPLRGGKLSGKYTRANAGSQKSDRTNSTTGLTESEYAIVDVVNEVAAEVGTNTAAVALAWVHSRPGVASTLIGARRLDQLKANLDGIDVVLSSDQIARLDAVSKPILNFPADNNRDLAPSLAFAGATVDGIKTKAIPMLEESGTRY